jgi:predicted phosphoribosyltransferase
MAWLFHSRVDAAAQLARVLYRFRGCNPLVLAIPRGAVEMGAVVAEALEGDLSLAHASTAARDRVALVIDDGIATGRTMIAALKAARASMPTRLVCAVPVASRKGLEAVAPYADEVVCLHAGPDFQAIRHSYQEFPQVHEAEVAKLLARTAAVKSAAHP